MTVVTVTGLMLARCATWGDFYRLLDSAGVAVDDYKRMLFEPVPIKDGNIPDMLRAFLITPYRWREDPYTDQLMIEQFYDPKEKSTSSRDSRSDWHSSEVQRRSGKGLLGGGRFGVLDYKIRPRQSGKSLTRQEFGW